jgi:hypothetical protein
VQILSHTNRLGEGTTDGFRTVGKVRQGKVRFTSRGEGVRCQGSGLRAQGRVTFEGQMLVLCLDGGALENRHRHLPVPIQVAEWQRGRVRLIPAMPCHVMPMRLDEVEEVEVRLRSGGTQEVVRRWEMFAHSAIWEPVGYSRVASVTPLRPVFALSFLSSP